MPVLQYSPKRSKHIYSISSKYARTLETGNLPPQTYQASSKPLVPKDARAGSVTDYLTRKRKRSSFGIRQLAQVICEQQYIFSKWAPLKEHTGSSKSGMDLHKDFLQVPSPAGKLQLPITTAEEEAARLFFNIPFTVKRLLRKTARQNEFTVIGHHFDRAFIGSIDSVEAEVWNNFAKLKIHEVKTTNKAELTDGSKERAVVQASLYVFFVQKMLSRDPYFDFEAYFRSRGLNINRPFTPQFAKAFPLHQFQPKGIPKGIPKGMPPPINLKDLVDRWRKWIDSLPLFAIDDYIYVTTLSTGRISQYSGFGSTPTVQAKPVRYDVDVALRIGKNIIDLLDGHRKPNGMPPSARAFCRKCEFHVKCPFTPELWNVPVEPLSASIPGSLLERWKQMVPPILSPTPRVSSNLSSMLLVPLRPSAAESSLVYKQLEEALQAERRRRRPHLSATFERLRNLHEAQAPAVKQRSLLTRELTAIKEQTTGLSSIERRNRAKIIVVRKTAEKRKAAEEAKKIEAVQRKTQRKAQRAMTKSSQDRPKGLGKLQPFSGVVPYLAPTRTTASIALYKPSMSRARLKRRQERGQLAYSFQKIPHGGQAIPEDHTYSVAQLQASIEVPKNWTYQFDSLPSLAQRQAAMTARETKEIAMGLNPQATKFTDAELEDMAREARRAKRRKEREGTAE